jgi:sugar lactone lactonase YvrE
MAPGNFLMGKTDTTGKMGKQSLLQHASTRIALLLLLALQTLAYAQTSALTVPLILPSAIVFDSAGDLYFAETANDVVREVDTTGRITTIAGSGTQGFAGDNGLAIAASLDSPQGLALDTGNNLYIADTHNHRIRRLNLATGIITTVAGTDVSGFSGDNAAAATAQLNLPTALALDTANNLYLADTGNHRIRRIDAATGIISTIAGNGIQGFSGDNGPATSAAIDSPTGLAVTSGSLYLADTHNHRIRRLNLTTGILTTLAGTGSLGFSGDSAQAISADLALPHGLTIDASGNLYLADTGNNRIRRIDAATGIMTTVAGTGTQTFSGDNGPAIAASLDTPRALALTPSALLTFGDTGNQRIRQLASAPGSSTAIHTIAGLGGTLPEALTLDAPSVIFYGTGQVIAALATSTPATGNIVFLSATNVTLATVPLTANTATFSTGNLPAGSYRLIASYAGDQTHLSAQSPVFTFNIAPQTLTAALASISLPYGQPIPALAGVITGILPQDAGNVTASFSTTAAALSPIGTYPIAASLSGPAAANYTLAAIPATITINPASTSISLSNLIATATSGSAITLTTHVASSTAGMPSGFVSLLNGGIQLASTALSNGNATFSNLNLSPGDYTLTAVYNGSANFLSSTSSPQQIAISASNSTPPSSADFTLTASGTPSQTILSGTSASFTFTIQPQGSLSSAVTLAATGLPNLATASFNPPTVPPAAASSSFTLTIATPETTARNHAPQSTWALFLLPILGFTLRTRTRTFSAKLLAVALCSIALLAATGCGDRVDTASSATTAASKSYTITVTGTATTPTGAILQHSANITLILAPAS